MIRRAIQFITNREWLMFLGFVEAAAIAIDQAADVLPADAAAPIYAAAALVIAYIGRLRVYAAATVDRLTGN